MHGEKKKGDGSGGEKPKQRRVTGERRVAPSWAEKKETGGTGAASGE